MNDQIFVLFRFGMMPPSTGDCLNRFLKTKHSEFISCTDNSWSHVVILRFKECFCYLLIFKIKLIRLMQLQFYPFSFKIYILQKSTPGFYSRFLLQVSSPGFYSRFLLQVSSPGFFFRFQHQVSTQGSSTGFYSRFLLQVSTLSFISCAL